MVLSSFVGLNLNGEHRCCRAKPPPPLHLDEMFVVLWLSTMLHSIGPWYMMEKYIFLVDSQQSIEESVVYLIAKMGLILQVRYGLT